MDRVAVFVDAGYLFSGGSEAIEGAALPRVRVRLDQDKLLERLKAAADQLSDGLPLLRIYWYDGLLSGRPSLEQSALADIDNIKMRFGTVSGGSQKGVDSLIVTDLVELARNGAICDAVIMSGDEDIRIGVQLAQSYGVRVHLIGLASLERNQARTLMQEADTTTIWTAIAAREFLSVVARPEEDAHNLMTELSSIPSPDQTEQLRGVAIGFAAQLSDADLVVVQEELLREPNRVPWEHDRRLLRESAGLLNRQLSEDERHSLRASFLNSVARRLDPDSKAPDAPS